MLRNTLTALALVALATPAFAADTMGTNNTGNGAMSNDMSMDSMTCQQMMDKGQPMYDGMMAGPKKTMAMSDMSMAKKSMTANNEADCKMHMQKAMDDMK